MDTESSIELETLISEPCDASAGTEQRAEPLAQQPRAV